MVAQGDAACKSRRGAGGRDVAGTAADIIAASAPQPYQP